jgi:hypothetical protein
MNCFNHNDSIAVGICKSCGKALCTDCVTELENGLACKGRCEKRVKLINQMLDSNVKSMNATRNQVKNLAIFGAISGLGFIFFGIWSYREFHSSYLPYFLGTIGALTLVSSLLRLTRRQTYPVLEADEIASR